MTGRTAQSGYGLVEVLVALVVLALAVAGTVVVVSNSLNRQAAGRLHAAALEEASYRLEIGAAGTGEASLSAQGVQAHWVVSRREIRSGQLGGVDVLWFETRSEVTWVWRGRERRVELERVRIEPTEVSR